MFNSGISASSLIADLQNEVDIAPPISNASYVMWLNSLEHILYTEFIQEQKQFVIEAPGNSPIDISDIAVGNDESAVRFEDIYTVFADKTQLIKSTVTSGVIFPDTYYKTGNNIGFSTQEAPGEIKIIYFVKPALKTVGANDTISAGNVMVPVEFIDLVKAKLRGEAYKVANEDSLAAKWINEYNVMLENFKAWLTNKAPQFGM